MKLAVLADIHANYIGLQTIAAHAEAWQPDLIIVAGDIINRGPRPLECWEFVAHKRRTQNWQVIRGNHEDYVLTHIDPNAHPDPIDRAIAQSSLWTYNKIGEAVSAVQALPHFLHLTAPDQTEIRIAHASMQGNRIGIYPWQSLAQIRPLIGDALPALFCVGHTHIPLIRCVENTTVVNVGSAGLPFDGDTRLAYAQITFAKGAWQVEIVRLNYDLAQAERAHFETGYHTEGGPLAQLVVEELRTAKSAIFQWTEKYERAVRAGEIGMEESVKKFLEERKDTH